MTRLCCSVVRCKKIGLPLNRQVRTGGQHERVAEPSSRQALLQVSHSICAEVSETGDLRDITERDWRDNPGVMSSGWSGISRGICDAGSYTPAVNDSAEVQCGPYGGFSEREVGDPDFSGVSAGEAEFHGTSFLGSGLLRQYGRIRGAGGPGVHSEPGTGRETSGADATGRALTIAPSGGFHHTTRSAGGS